MKFIFKSACHSSQTQLKLNSAKLNSTQPELQANVWILSLFWIESVSLFNGILMAVMATTMENCEREITYMHRHELERFLKQYKQKCNEINIKYDMKIISINMISYSYIFKSV